VLLNSNAEIDCSAIKIWAISWSNAPMVVARAARCSRAAVAAAAADAAPAFVGVDMPVISAPVPVPVPVPKPGLAAAAAALPVPLGAAMTPGWHVLSTAAVSSRLSRSR
jgi:hypothetical protein